MFVFIDFQQRIFYILELRVVTILLPEAKLAVAVGHELSLQVIPAQFI